MNSRNMAWVAALLLCTTIAASGAALFYWNEGSAVKMEYEALVADLDELTIKVDIKLDYGNGTVVWYNGTRVSLDASLLKATSLVADLETLESDFGVLVTSINGVEGSSSVFWLWDYLEEGAWQYGPVGADQWTLHNGDTVAWTYTTF